MPPGLDFKKKNKKLESVKDRLCPGIKQRLVSPLNAHRYRSRKDRVLKCRYAGQMRRNVQGMERRTCQSRVTHWSSLSAGEPKLISSALISVTTVKCNFCLNRSGE